jgi:hypothetical protein
MREVIVLSKETVQLIVRRNDRKLEKRVYLSKRLFELRDVLPVTAEVSALAALHCLRK